MATGALVVSHLFSAAHFGFRPFTEAAALAQRLDPEHGRPLNT
ncbi:hypothetical protein [Novosphingobium sp. G106]|nr:hypothetical protein [Novosphingobium sp. G106]